MRWLAAVALVLVVGAAGWWLGTGGRQAAGIAAVPAAPISDQMSAAADVAPPPEVIHDVTAFVARMDSYDRAGDQAAVARGREQVLARALAQAEAGQAAQGEWLLRQWLALFPRDLQVLASQSDLLQMQGQPRQAMNPLLEALQYNGSVAEQKPLRDRLRLLVDTMVQQLLQRGEPRQVLELYQDLVERDPLHLPWRVAAAQAAARAGDLDTAAGHIDLIPEWEVDDSTWAGLQDLLASRETAAETAPAAGSLRLLRRGDQLLAPVVLAGRRLRLLVDTGATITTLKRSSVAGLTGLRDTGERVRMRTAGGDRTGELMEAAQLVLGGRPYGPVVVAVLDLERLADTDGLLGMDLLQQFALQPVDGDLWLVKLP